MDSLTQQFTQLQNQQLKFNTIQTQLQLQQSNNQKQIDNISQQITQDQHHLQLLEQSHLIFKQLQDSLTHKQIEHIETLTNDALKSVFNDEQFNYSIKIETDISNQRPQAKFILTTTNLITTEETHTLLQANGGGINSLIGFILQVFYILNTNQEHLMFIDEGLTAISKDHLPKLKEFIKQISHKFNFTFILVVHDRDLLELADYTYLINDGTIKQLEVQ